MMPLTPDVVDVQRGICPWPLQLAHVTQHVCQAAVACVSGMQVMLRMLAAGAHAPEPALCSAAASCDVVVFCAAVGAGVGTAAACCLSQDPDLRAAAQLIQSALNASSVQEEEALWTQVGGWLPCEV
jgi:hypothetical protein